MTLYIMRHGIAPDGWEWTGPDTTRPLTEDGRQRVRQLAELLKTEKALAPLAIWSSPLVRAHQTAEIVGEVLGQPVQVVDKLACGCNFDGFVKMLKALAAPAKLLTVGHNPDCGEIIADLLGDTENSYNLKKGAVACLEGKPVRGGMKLVWKRGSVVTI